MSGYVPNSRLSSMIVCRPCCRTVVLTILHVSGPPMKMLAHNYPFDTVQMPKQLPL